MKTDKTIVVWNNKRLVVRKYKAKSRKTLWETIREVQRDLHRDNEDHPDDRWQVLDANAKVMKWID